MGDITKQNQQNANTILQAELLATVSHELRGPLTAIKGYARTLLRHGQQLPREERQEFLQAIDEASDRLALALDRFFELAQLETGAFSLAIANVHLVDLIHDAMIAARQRSRQISTKDHSLQPLDRSTSKQPFHFTMRLPKLPCRGYRNSKRPYVRGDQQRLREVLDQLLDNAIIYSPGGGTIEITLSLQPLSIVPYEWPRDENTQAEGYVIAVHDPGIGIEHEHLQNIFQRFYRVDTRLVREVNGLGLGLTICKALIELHHGYIWAESEYGQGSKFMIWLPVAHDIEG